MVVYASFELPADGIRIGRAFAQFPEIEVELDRIVPTAGAVVPFIWVRGADPAEVIDVTLTDAALEDIQILDTEPGGWTLYRVVWDPSFRDTVVAIAEADIALLSGTGTAEQWSFEFRAASREPLSAFQEYLRANRIPATLVSVTEVAMQPQSTTNHVTDLQREALRLAFDRGYFDEPRAVKLDTLAAEIGITRQAFSGRLRRGIRNVLADRFDAAAE